MMQAESTIMPLFWDVMPVSLIFYLHKYNFEDKPPLVQHKSVSEV